MFPFEYSGKTFYSCTTLDTTLNTPWCQTSPTGERGDCNEICPILANPEYDGSTKPRLSINWSGASECVYDPSQYVNQPVISLPDTRMMSQGILRVSVITPVNWVIEKLSFEGATNWDAAYPTALSSAWQWSVQQYRNNPCMAEYYLTVAVTKQKDLSLSSKSTK